MFTIHQEVWSEVRPYLVDALTHFAVFCLTSALIFLMVVFSWLMLTICNHLFHEVPLALYMLIYESDIFILIHFTRKLM